MCVKVILFLLKLNNLTKKIKKRNQNHYIYCEILIVYLKVDRMHRDCNNGCFYFFNNFLVKNILESIER